MDIETLKGLGTEEQLEQITYIFESWDDLCADDKKQVLAFVSRKINLKKAIFTGGNGLLVSILGKEKVKIRLDILRKYITCANDKQDCVMAAALLEYQKNVYTAAQISHFDEKQDLIEIGLEYPTYAQLRTKWKTIKLEKDEGIGICGYIGDNTHEILPDRLKDGTPIRVIAKVGKEGYGKLEKKTIKAQLTCIHSGAFDDCSQLRELVLPDSIQWIGRHAFSECVQIEMIEFADMENCNLLIEKYAFYSVKYADQYVTVVLPKNTICEEDAFELINIIIN